MTTQLIALVPALCSGHSFKPVTVSEAMMALIELHDAGYGRALPTFDAERERAARLKVLDLQERYLIAGGAA